MFAMSPMIFDSFIIMFTSPNMLGDMNFVMDESEIVGNIVKMKREDWRGVGSGVAVGAATAISAQGYADQRFPGGMGSRGFAGGGTGEGCDTRAPIETPALGARRAPGRRKNLAMLRWRCLL